MALLRSTLMTALAPNICQQAAEAGDTSGAA
jgi:hypothetical protein